MREQFKRAISDSQRNRQAAYKSYVQLKGRPFYSLTLQYIPIEPILHPCAFRTHCPTNPLKRDSVYNIIAFVYSLSFTYEIIISLISLT